MLTLVFYVLLFIVFIRLVGLAVRAAWGFLKVLAVLFLLPGVLILLAVAGLTVVALPILIIVGVAALIN